MGSKLVDAKGVSRLYRQRISGWSVLLMLVAGILAVGVALWATDGGRALLLVLAANLDDLWTALKDWVT